MDPRLDAEALAGVIGTDFQARTRRLLHQLSGTGRTLATAESCTGGLLASLFTDIPGASHVLDRGLVVYSLRAKQDLLGIPEEMLETHGAVSKPVAVAMAEALVRQDGPDIGVSITGYADTGPEPGLVHMAVAHAGGDTVHRVRRFGTVGRGAVRLRTLSAALDLLEETL